MKDSTSMESAGTGVKMTGAGTDPSDGVPRIETIELMLRRPLQMERAGTASSAP